MDTLDLSGKTVRAVEITAALSGHRFGLCGFNPGEAQKICRILSSVNALAFTFEESLLAESGRVCDAILIKLANLGPDGLRASATSTAPILVIGSIQAMLEGVAGAYSWPRDFMNESWAEAELLVRLFRLLGSGSLTALAGKPRMDPLILLADDDPELITLVEATLRNDGISCRTADNGLRALRMAREIKPDLVLLDVRMPGMNGFEVLQTIRGDPGLQTLPVILLTSCDDASDIMRGSDLRADQYIAKPVSPNILLNRVKRLLASHSRSSARWTRTLTGVGSNGKVIRKWALDSNPYEGAAGQA